MKLRSRTISGSKRQSIALQNNQSESDIQIQVVEYLNLMAAKCGFLFFSCPNEGMGQAKTGAGIGRMVRMKKMGMRSGVGDLIIIKTGRAHFLEMKKPGGRQSQNQKDFQKEAEACGAFYAVADSFDLTMEYLRIWKIIP